MTAFAGDDQPPAVTLGMVWDCCAEGPVLMSPDEASEGGRGLMIVDALSVRWGWQRDRIGKTMWSLIAT